MGRSAIVRFAPLQNCLVNLPLSITGPLSQRAVPPQSIAVQLSVAKGSGHARGAQSGQSPTALIAGWTGLSSSIESVSSHLSHARGGASIGDTIEIDPQYAQMSGLGLQEGTLVNIELLRDLQVANSVNVTPLSADDWEILETNAEFVEMYLLNQVRAIKVGMTVACWINRSTLVKFIVDSTEPEVPPNSSLPLLLTSATELIVAPKSRHTPSAAATGSKPHDLSSSTAATTVHHPEWPVVRKKLLRLLPLEVLPTSQFEATDSGKGRDDEVYLNRQLCRKLQEMFGRGSKLGLMVQPRPSRSGAVSGGATTSNEDGGGVSTKANGHDHASSKKESASTDEKQQNQSISAYVEVRLREGETVGDGQVWIGESLRNRLGLVPLESAGHHDEDGRFELLRLGPPGSATTDATAGKPQANGHSSSSASSSLPPSAPTVRRQPQTELAGVESQLSSLSSHVINSLAARRFSSSDSSSFSSSSGGILVTGASGAGKTALIKEIGHRMSRDPRAFTRTIFVDCSKYSEERPATLKNRIKDWFDQAAWHAPSLLLLDNLDRLIPAEVEHADSFASLHMANTFLGIAQATSAASGSSRPVVLVATAQSTSSLHPLLTTTHLLGETVGLKGPTKSARKEILNSLIQTKISSSDLSLDSRFNSASIAAITEGYLPADLRDFVDRAVHQSAIRTMTRSPGANLVLTADDFNQAQIGFVPLSLRDVKLQKSLVQWSDIGGLHETRKTLRETLEWPTKYGAIFASCPLRLRSGLLLYGYPGCGKTLLASAVAKECGLNFISVKGPEILNKYIGASEKSVRDLFDRAQAAKPCVLFFDEFDSIAPKRGHDSTGVTDRVVNQMLTQMDGAEGLDGVYVLAATSRPDLIDPALLRPGRLDKSLLCDMPSYADRLEIMQACSRKLHLSPSVSLEEFAKLTPGYSGADLQAVMYNAHLDAIHTQLNEQTHTENGTEPGQGGKAENGSDDSQEIKYVEMGGPHATTNGQGRAVNGAPSQGGVRSKAEQAVVNKRLEQILANLKETKRAASKSSKLAGGAASIADRKPTVVEPHHLRKSLETTRPSVPSDELQRLRKIYNDFVSTRSKGGLPSGEASDQVGGRASLM